MIVKLFRFGFYWVSVSLSFRPYVSVLLLYCTMLDSSTYINSIVSVLDSILKKIGVGLVSASCLF